ncbi:MAG: YbjQ family protein [Ignavibacteriaceae bacterium]|jgi:uncharacterized protein YbjQ (UPF0145 family)
MDHKLITTGLTIEGYKITENLGIVRGIIVRSRSIFGNIGAAFQTIVGGNITLYTELCEKTREDSFDVMVQHAQQLGADGIISFRYDANDVMQGVTEILAYGTAVKLQKM